jgi:tetratricopeptide (TPR) repeat protein
MNTDESLQVSGYDKSRILMELSYVAVFRCGICTRMVSLDSVVSNCCIQPYCVACLDEYESELIRREQSACPCPRCYEELCTSPSTESKQSDDCRLAVKSLQSSQPLAFKILKLTTVTCLHDSCEWTGIYSDFMVHIHQHNKSPSIGRRNISIAHVSNSKKNENLKERFVLKNNSEQRCLNKSVQMFAQRARKIRSLSIDSVENALVDATSFKGNQSFVSNSDTSHWEENCNDDESITSEFVNLSNCCHKQQEAFAKAEKLKKQANAKFNAKNFLEARRLYSDGINMVKCFEPSSDNDNKLLSDMYSNRAATFYRDKCIEDCEHAIRYEPALDKSWIRKWRSLSAKGEFHAAYSFLGEALEMIPDSIRIKEEYDNAKKEMDTLILIQRQLDMVDPLSAQVTRKYSLEMSNSENILLLLYYAKNMLANADVESALKVLDRALEINPNYVDCLELKGLCHFYNGAVDHGVRILAEAYEENDQNTQLKKEMTRVQKTHEFYVKAQFEIQNGRLEEANEHLTAAINASDPLPAKSLLFCKLRTDRANNSLQLLQYLSALQDCKDVIDVHREYAPIWVVRSEILMSLGKVKEARKELKHIRRTWGLGDVNITSSYHRVDFEFRVSRANDDVILLQNELDSGICDILPVVNFFDPLSRRTSHCKAGRKTDAFDPLGRKTSHSKREKRCDDLTTTVNPTESLSRRSSHIKGEKASDSLDTAAAIGKSGLCRKSSFHEKHNNSSHKAHKSSKPEPNESPDHETVKPSRSRGNSSKSDTEMDHATPNPRKPPERRNSSHCILSKSVAEVSSCKVEAGCKMDPTATNPKTQPERRNSTRTILSHAVAEVNGVKPDAKLDSAAANPRKALERRNSIHVVAETNSPTDNPGKPLERRKSTQNLLRRDRISENEMVDKLVVRKQVQRSKTLDGIFGCDWRNVNTEVKPVHSVRPGTQRSKSSDLGELRKSLSDIYSKSTYNKL